jgi:hypothetical protein
LPSDSANFRCEALIAPCHFLAQIQIPIADFNIAQIQGRTPLALGVITGRLKTLWKFLNIAGTLRK